MRRNLSLLGWTVTMAVLYFLFGRWVGGLLEDASFHLAGSLRAHAALTTDLSAAAVGPLLLGLSRLYRGGARQENAGSMAAWLAGWALLLYYGSQAVSRYSTLLASLLLLALLATWLAQPVAARALARRRH